MKMYAELARWWPLLSTPTDYDEEAEEAYEILSEACQTPPRTCLELGSGGGNNASYLKRTCSMTLVDLSPGMLAVSQALNPECEHILGDMRSIRLDRLFDCAFIHDAVVYMTSEADLLAALRTAYVHLKPGGAVLIEPDYTRENFAAKTDHGGHDSPDGSGLRYLEWFYDPDPGDTTYLMHFAFLLREPDGKITCEYDQHVCGLFSKADWLRIMREAGFQAEAQDDSFERVVFVGRKPA